MPVYIEPHAIALQKSNMDQSRSPLARAAEGLASGATKGFEKMFEHHFDEFAKGDEKKKEYVKAYVDYRDKNPDASPDEALDYAVKTSGYSGSSADVPDMTSAVESSRKDIANKNEKTKLERQKTYADIGVQKATAKQRSMAANAKNDFSSVIQTALDRISSGEDNETVLRDALMQAPKTSENTMKNALGVKSEKVDAVTQRAIEDLVSSGAAKEVAQKDFDEAKETLTAQGVNLAVVQKRINMLKPLAAYGENPLVIDKNAVTKQSQDYLNKTDDAFWDISGSEKITLPNGSKVNYKKGPDGLWYMAE